MHKTKQTLSEAKALIDENLHAGISLGEIPKLASMIGDYECVEAYVCKHHEHHGDAAKPDSSSWIDRRIESELAAAQAYVDKWMETKHPDYKQLASDELRHADIFIKQAQQAGTPTAVLQSALARRDGLAAKLA